MTALVTLLVCGLLLPGLPQMFPDAPQILTSGGSERSEAERGCSNLSAFTCFDSVGNFLACFFQVGASEAKRSEAVLTSVLLLVLILCQLSCMLFQVGASAAKRSEAVLTSVLLFASIELETFLHACQFSIP